jgi:hypothetical protein
LPFNPDQHAVPGVAAPLGANQLPTHHRSGDRAPTQPTQSILRRGSSAWVVLGKWRGSFQGIEQRGSCCCASATARLSWSLVVFQSVSDAVPDQVGLARVHLRPFVRTETEVSEGTWPLACFRDRLGTADNSTVHDRLSWTYLLLQRPTFRSCRLSQHRPKTTRLQPAPFLRFSAPSTHQVWEIYLHGLPHPLSSACVVSSTLTVCSLPDPAGLFHPAAFLAFRGCCCQSNSAEARPSR